MAIKGYRQLTAEELALVNQIKEAGEALETFVNVMADAGADKRWIAIAKTNLQQGLMALTRSITQPETFA
jgi:hypothetical protein